MTKKVWIVNYGSNDSYNNERLLSEFERRGFACTSRIFKELTPFGKRLFTHDINTPESQELFEQPDLIFFNNSIKIQESRRDRHELVLSNLRAMKPNTLFINDLDSHVNASLKHTVYETLERANIPMPKTKVYYDWNASDSFIQQILQEFSLPVVVKSTDGYGGSGSDLCANSSDLKIVLEGRLTQDDQAALPIIVQNYEKDSEGLLIKVRLIGNKIEAVYRMYSPYAEQAFKSEKEIGHMCIAMNVDQQLENFVRKIAETLGIEVAWLDLFVSNGQYKFCEINVPGGIFNSMFNNTNFAAEIVDYCAQRLEEKGV